jgi:hypothetical protein
VAELTDSGLAKKRRVGFAEETRPKRELIKEYRRTHRSKKGRKLKAQPREAKYHNWFTPLCWVIIEQAARVAGWQMSATQIVKICQARQPQVFAGLTRETVKCWIDRSGSRPRWSDATLSRVQAGNVPGHSNGGPRGALVSSPFTFRAYSLTVCRPIIQRLWMPSKNDSQTFARQEYLSH